MGKTQSQYDEVLQEELKNSGDIPTHIAIIMDGNGRWANKRGLPRVAGHKKGVDTVRDIVEACAQLGVRYLSLYTFSTENWNRPKDEVSMLMRLLLNSLKQRLGELTENDIKLTTIGDISSLPNDVQKQLMMDMERAPHFDDVSFGWMLPKYGNETYVLDGKFSEGWPLPTLVLNDEADKGGHTFLTYLIYEHHRQEYD